MSATFPQNPINYDFYRNSRGSDEGLQPQIKDKLPLIAEVFRKYTNSNYQLTITAGQEWHHGHGLMSLHHNGFAVDVRTLDLPGGSFGHVGDKITAELKQKLGRGYFVQNEKSKHHIHIQWTPGARMSNPGDFEPPQSRA